jgi:hypothetical protein
MRAWVCSVGIGSIAVVVLACGSKGSGDDSSTAGAAAESGGASGSTGIAGTTSTTAGAPAGGASAGGASAGSTSIAGTGGAPGGTITQSYTFDTTTQGWTTISSSTDPSDATLMAVDVTKIVASWAGTDGDPSPGALQLAIPYSSKSQYVSIGINVGMADATKPKVDLTGKTLTAFVKIVSGLESTAELMSVPPGAQLYIKTGPGYDYENSTYTNITAVDTWVPLSFELDNPSFVADAGALDLSDVREIGVQINSSGTTTTAAPAVVLIDTVSY